MNEDQLIVTDDGSHSLKWTHRDHYHSRHGAVQESLHVFLDAGFRHKLNLGYTHIRILEVGWGTGLNSYLTINTCPESISLDYIALEPNPVSKLIVQRLNYSMFQDPANCYLDDLHQLDWEKWYAVGAKRRFYKTRDRFEDYVPPTPGFDIIYYDAFSPLTQPELWLEGCFKKCFDSLRPGGIWVSYCAKGEVKRMLKQAGFHVEALPGPPPKREMTRAVKRVG